MNLPIFTFFSFPPHAPFHFWRLESSKITFSNFKKKILSHFGDIYRQWKKAGPKYLRFLKWVAFSFREIGTIPFPVEKILAQEEEEVEVSALPTTAKSS